MSVAQPPAWRFAVDRGGTFTDVVATTPDGRLVTEKLLSENPGHYPDAASEAVRRLMARYGEAAIAELRIGTTVATNALLERKGERLALAITRGFADALRIGTQARPHIFARHIVLPEQLPAKVVEIDERVAVDGTVLRPVDPWVPRSHTRMANGGAVGVAMCCMAGAQERPFAWGKAPMTAAQLDAMAEEVARLCIAHDIPVTRWSVLTHAEVQPTLGIAQRRKWDVLVLPGMARPGDPFEVGDRIRAMITAKVKAA
jgi:5-oxoprolinase (ATP-hydrolysing)